MKREVIVFVGMQASGKTSFYRANFASTHEHVSKDELPKDNKATWQFKRIRELLEDGRDIVVDNTHPSVNSRAEVKAACVGFDIRLLCFHWAPDFDACWKRNVLRFDKPPIPAVGLKMFMHRYEPPTLAEGFEDIFEITAR